MIYKVLVPGTSGASLELASLKLAKSQQEQEDKRRFSCWNQLLTYQNRHLQTPR